MTGSTQQVHQELQAWAAGVYTSEAATELLIGALGGTFASVSHPWIKYSDGGLWIDFQCIPEHLGPMSGGEQRLLRIAASLGCGDIFVNLADNVTGLDAPTPRLVLVAIAHSGGWQDRLTSIIESRQGIGR